MRGLARLGGSVVTGPAWLVTALVVMAAAVVAWPRGGGRTRRRVVLAPLGGPDAEPSVADGHRHHGRLPAGAPAVRHRGPSPVVGRPSSSRPPGRRDPRRPAGVALPDHLRHAAASLWRVAAPTSGPTVGRRARRGAQASRRAALLVGAVSGGIGGGLAGPVAAVVLAAYGALGTRAVLRRRAGRHGDQARRQSLDQLCALAADLRAGLSIMAALGAARSGPVPPGGFARGPLGWVRSGPRTSDWSSADPVTRGGPLPLDALADGLPTSGAPSAAAPKLNGVPPGPLGLGRSAPTSGRRLAGRDAVTGSAPAMQRLMPVARDGGPGGAGRRSASDDRGRGRSAADPENDRSDGPDRVAELVRAAVRLADRTGAPLAELLERIEADARAADRGLAAAAAQAAGARATAWLLAALPLGGIGLGYAIGVDPVAVLLHTPVGGASAVGAVALQIGGLLWAERLGAGPGRVG
ncbi:hypothetical protein GCM10023176_26490 [Micromonospora coerulea]|uniref:Tight adherence protein B n=1 Tax=Micromonospora coerulea TaxID=47856 RepID=A0ABP8SL93_9ACTN